MNMKRFTILGLLAFALLMGTTSCNFIKKKLRQKSDEKTETILWDFAYKFGKNASENMKDSLMAVYPHLTPNDSIVLNYSPDKINVDINNEEDGEYIITMAPDVTIKVRVEEDGTCTVTESKGLFYFPKDKMDIARKTGMWTSEIYDVELAQRMQDGGFFAHINDMVKKQTKNIISLGSETGDGYRYVHNNTDKQINAGDYNVNTVEYYQYEGPYAGWNYYGDYYDYDWRYGEKKHSRKGKAIPPHGSVAYDSWGDGWSGEYVKSISIKIPEDELVERFATFTGNEYQDYISSRGAK